MNALEAYKAKAGNLQKVHQHRQTIRRVVDAGEMGVGAVLAGAADAKLPPIMGAKPSLVAGIVLVTAGVALEQRDAASIGLGMLLPNLYMVGAGLAV